MAKIRFPEQLKGLLEGSEYQAPVRALADTVGHILADNKLPFFCHVQNDYASDEKPNKQKARRMLKLMQMINADFGDDKMRVSCFTCHRGETIPKTAPAPQSGQ